MNDFVERKKTFEFEKLQNIVHTMRTRGILYLSNTFRKIKNVKK